MCEIRDMTWARRTFAATLALAAGVSLAGCAAPGGGYADLARDREQRDELPGVAAAADEAIDASSSRYVGAHEGASLWLAQGRDPGSICLVVDAGPERNQSACSSGGVSVRGSAGRFAVIPDGEPAPEGGTRISANVFAVPAAHFGE